MTSSEAAYQIQSGNGYSIVSLLPKLNDVPWAEIERIGSEILQALRTAAHPVFLVDLSALHHAGSALVALILRVWKRASEQKGRMIVVNSDQMVFEVLQLAGLTKVWTIVATQEDAIREVETTVFTRSGRSVSILLNFLGFFALAGAAAGLFYRFYPTRHLPEQMASAMHTGFAVLTIIAGLVSTLRTKRLGRVIGIILFVAGLGITMAGIWYQLCQV